MNKAEIFRLNVMRVVGMLGYPLICVLFALALCGEALAQPQTMPPARDGSFSQDALRGTVRSPMVSLQWRVGLGKRVRRDAKTVSLGIGMTDGGRLWSHRPVMQVTPASGRDGSLRFHQVPVLRANGAQAGKAKSKGMSTGQTILIVGGIVVVVALLATKDSMEAVAEDIFNPDD